jgi:serine/threonine protein phosphatase PrpC
VRIRATDAVGDERRDEDRDGQTPAAPEPTSRIDPAAPSGRPLEDPRDEPGPGTDVVEYAQYRSVGRRPPSYSPEPGAPAPSADGGALIPDSAVDGFSVGALTVRGASVKGDGHRAGGLPRQDAMALCVLGRGCAGADRDVVAVFVADGVGSALRSHLGAAAACAAAVELCVALRDDLAEALARDDRDLLLYQFVHIADATAERLRGLAAQHGIAPEAVATTLRALLVPIDRGNRLRAAFWVGDGGTFRLRGEGWESVDPGAGTAPLLAASQAGTVVHSTATAALPDGASALRAAFWCADPGETAVVCTDGLSEPLKDRDFAALLEKDWAAESAPGTVRFLWQAQNRLRSYDDDRTVVCIWERGVASLPAG